MNTSTSAILSAAVLTILAACSPNTVPASSSTDTASAPSASTTPAPGCCSFTRACTNLTQDIDKDFAIANPQNKAFVKEEDLGIGTDSYLDYRFSKADSNKDQQLDKTELRTYLSDKPNLGSICKQP